MSTARGNHTATLLADGRVLVAGGIDGFSAELFNPATGTWSGTCNLREWHAWHTATRLADGRVLVVGGSNLDGGILDSAEIFDPATQTMSGTPSLHTGRLEHTATLLADGRVLVVGGSNNGILDSVEIYDPITFTWRVTNHMETARRHHTATLLADGRVLVVGGSILDVGRLDSAEIFDPATGIWSATNHMETAREDHTATLLADGRVLVVGGGIPGDSAEIFDPATQTWSGTGSLQTGRSHHTATLLAAGRVLVAGGWVPFFALDSAEIFDPATGIWSATDNLASARTDYTATRLADGRVLVAGGYAGGGNYLARAEVYDPQNYINNGSFEAASVDPVNGTIALPSGSTAITNWTVGDAGIDYRQEYWQPAEGYRSLHLNGASGRGSIRTYFYTYPGWRYKVTFAMAGNPDGGPVVKSLWVSAGGDSQDFSFDTTGKSRANMGWSPKSWTFRAKSFVTGLEFFSLTGGVYGPALDRVRVVRQVSLLPLMLLLD
jgi:choice-of-anchor C domain-containing protein